MLEQEDREAIVTTVLEMLEEQISNPMEKLFDCLLFELMSKSALDYTQMAERLEALWQTMPEHEQDGLGGRLYYRYLLTMQSLRDEPEKWLSTVPNSDEPQPRIPPDWFRGVIDGGRNQTDE